MTSSPQRTFLGHPLGLFVLFFTEMWERFSFYGMRALLILYMVNYFRWTQAEASEIYKVYISLVYVTPILGGYLADRFLGNRLAVIIGAVLMAIGHFLMAFEAYSIFIAALVFLIFGNGFFKPNMSTQVGRLYPANDGRRDGAYTIFYMGINLGAFMAPIACGWLAEHTQGEYHSGFTLAGIGMVIGLLTYLLGQPLIREVPHDQIAPSAAADKSQAEVERPLTEAEASATPTALPVLYRVATPTMYALGGLSALASVGLYFAGSMGFWDAVMLAVAGICLVVMARVCADVTGGVRDRVLAILALGIFVIFFWGAFEQAGNPLNLWADKTTNRYLTEAMPVPSVEPEAAHEEAAEEVAGASGTLLTRLSGMFKLKQKPAAKDESWSLMKSFNPVPTAWFQSINALAIFVLAPLFAWMWIRLDRVGKQPSIPMKMTIGLLLVAAHMGLMIFAAKVENKPTTATIDPKLPGSIKLDTSGHLGVEDEPGEGKSKFHRFHAGRLTMTANGELTMMGVLPDTERDRIIDASAPLDFQKVVQQLVKESKTIDGDKVKQVSVDLPTPPEGFNLKLSGIPPKAVDYVDGKLIAKTPLADKEAQGLGVAGGNPAFRSTMQKLFQDSSKFRVSPMWLFWCYILATLGELCLSPVGLSMVSKLAPAKYSTMLMGVWLLTSSFGNFAAGAMGEVWGTIPPEEFFTLLAGVCVAAAAVLYVLCKKIVSAMHGVT